MQEPPDRSGVVHALWAVHPADGTHAGNLAFCKRVAAKLREDDPRWGLNWKRGVVGDPSIDVLAYRWGPADTDCRIVDIIEKASGPWAPGESPGPAWGVVSEDAAGPVRWFWTLTETPPPPPPEVDEDTDAILDALAAHAEVVNAYHDLEQTALDALRHDVGDLLARQDRALVGEFRLFGYRVAIRLTPED